MMWGMRRVSKLPLQISIFFSYFFISHVSVCVSAFASEWVSSAAVNFNISQNYFSIRIQYSGNEMFHVILRWLLYICMEFWRVIKRSTKMQDFFLSLSLESLFYFATFYFFFLYSSTEKYKHFIVNMAWWDSRKTRSNCTISWHDQWNIKFQIASSVLFFNFFFATIILTVDSL